MSRQRLITILSSQPERVVCYWNVPYSLPLILKEPGDIAIVLSEGRIHYCSSIQRTSLGSLHSQGNLLSEQNTKTRTCNNVSLSDTHSTYQARKPEQHICITDEQLNRN